MKTAEKTKFISDIDLEESKISVRKPFKLNQESRRRFIRLEISSPMSLNKIKDIFSNFWPEGDNTVISGTILNISPGGLLVEINEPLNEGDIVSMNFTLQGYEKLDKILGVVTRTDCQEDFIFAGLKFVSKSDLEDRLSKPELEMISDTYSNFTDTVSSVLKKFIYQTKVS